jgi:hypothetical protein
VPGAAKAEVFGWKQGLDEKLETARAFYAVVLLSTAVGIALDFARINPVRALYWTAIINGLLAPFLLVGILTRQQPHNQPVSRAEPAFRHSFDHQAGDQSVSFACRPTA